MNSTPSTVLEGCWYAHPPTHLIRDHCSQLEQRRQRRGPRRHADKQRRVLRLAQQQAALPHKLTGCGGWGGVGVEQGGAEMPRAGSHEGLASARRPGWHSAGRCLPPSPPAVLRCPPTPTKAAPQVFRQDVPVRAGAARCGALCEAQRAHQPLDGGHLWGAGGQGGVGGCGWVGGWWWWWWGGGGGHKRGGHSSTTATRCTLPRCVNEHGWLPLCSVSQVESRKAITEFKLFVPWRTSHSRHGTARPPAHPTPRTHLRGLKASKVLPRVRHRCLLAYAVNQRGRKGGGGGASCTER